jgi:hypothetical protein
MSVNSLWSNVIGYENPILNSFPSVLVNLAVSGTESKSELSILSERFKYASDVKPAS